MNKKDLLDFILSLDNRGLLSIPFNNLDYEYVIYDYLKKKDIIIPNYHQPPNQLPKDIVINAFQNLKNAINDKGCAGNAPLIASLVWYYLDHFTNYPNQNP